jgi:hypothetical protein
VARTLVISETIAMARDDQHVVQCAWCGTVVIYPGRPRDVLGACPACSRDVWWHQTFPIAGAQLPTRKA